VLVFTRSRLPKALCASSKGVMASLSSCEAEEVSEKREEGALVPLLFLFLLRSSEDAVVSTLFSMDESGLAEAASSRCLCSCCSLVRKSCAA